MTSYTLPSLDYSFSALEPHIDARTMEVHYKDHHQTYLNNLNKALQDAQYQAPECPYALVANLSAVPEAIRMIVRNHGGGYVNHCFFWKVIGPQAGGQPTGKLQEAIQATFGSFESFQEQFTKAALGRFGSGWAWLCKDAQGQLFITSTANQDSPWMQGVAEKPGCPIIGVDVWEHAYYLKYQSKRAEYLKAFWNVINWKFASERFEKSC